jgi:peptidoglycan/LPS O-acetylase OafA/YrhL
VEAVLEGKLTASSQEESRRPRIDSLVGVRFFAAIYVVFFHSLTALAAARHAPRWLVIFLGHGYLAVSLFFILSGFVLTYNYADGWSESSFRYFLLARFARIYPVYVLALLLQLRFYWDAASLFKSFAVVFMVQSWTVMPSPLPGAWNYPAWTLSIEWFFYLCFPLLLRGLARAGNKAAPLWIACFLSVLVGGAQVAIGGRSSWFASHFPMPLLRLPEFFLGMLLARYRPRRFFEGNWPILISTTVAMLLLVLNTHRFVTLIVVPFAAIIWLLANEESSVRRLLGTKALVLLGGASYAIYILQAPMLRWMTAWMGHPLGVWTTVLLYAPGLILAGMGVFVVFEEPARGWIRKNGADIFVSPYQVSVVPHS